MHESISNFFKNSQKNTLFPQFHFNILILHRHDSDQPVWDGVLKFNPDLWVWLGDIVYADHHYLPSYWKPTPLPQVVEKFNIQKEKPGYKKLLDTCPVTGHWVRFSFILKLTFL